MRLRAESGTRSSGEDSAVKPTTAEASEALLAMSPIGDVVAVGVVADDLQRLVSIEPLSFQGHDDQALELRKGEGRSFF